MKKLSFALACFIGLLFFASCKKDESTNNDPEEKPLTITPITDEGFVTGGEEVLVLNSFKYGFVAQGTDLTLFTCTIESGGETTTDENELDNATYKSYESTFLPSSPGEVKITGTIKNAKGETTSATIIINAVGAENDKFIGNYAGEIVINGTIEVTIFGETQTQPLDEQKTDIEMKITAGNENDEVIANFEMEGQPANIKGKCKNNHVDFEPVSETIAYEGQQINCTFIMRGNLDGNTLNVSGNINATGTLTDPQIPMPVPFVVKANMSGPLARQ